MNTAKRYISSIAEKFNDRIINGDGYYHDVVKLKNKHEIKSVGTTNYNNFIGTITGEDVYYLNGSVDDCYDPYLNTIVSSDVSLDAQHFTVPFLFTQIGIKPLTSIKMSERYVHLYNNLKESDIIAVIGYGFNVDDGHINGLFRSCIEDEGKELVIFHYMNDFSSESDLKLKEHYQEKLRLKDHSGITIIKVDRDRKTPDGIIWHEAF
ncbi:hypothetical protein [Vibrio parahaemolyticus]|uniref:hypothetical protein n=1 Tax=Vibrio parahaemolyticus TaxID=670 RepID=UPI00112266FE|nr:hypothetical protein [Vibrio parahaemolyticus]MCS0094729.1 hypothetical protein [Vibrio parahaemolyticus]TPA02986.1 hypothetical protein DXE03_25020 [Vibrio parahaemolyticus]